MKKTWAVRVEDSSGHWLHRIGNDGSEGMLTEQQARVVARGLNSLFASYQIAFTAFAEVLTEE